MDKMSRYNSDIQENSGEGGGSSYTEQVVITKDQPNPLRIVDTPDGVERYYSAWMLCDDQKRRPFVLENDFQGKSLMAQMLGDRKYFYRGGFLESVKDEVTNKPKYVWAEKDPELALIVLKNGDPDGQWGSWKSREEYIFNAIQRNPDYNDAGVPLFWCKENKSTKLLKIGVMAYKRLMDVRANDGELSEYDINYMKKGAGFNTEHNILKASVNIPNVCIGALTPEEQSYRRLDLRKEASLITATDALHYFRNAICAIAAVMGVDWIGRFEEASAKEIESGAVTPREAKKEESPQEASVPQAAPAGTTTSTPAGTTTSTPTRRVPVSDPAMEPCDMCHEMIPVGSERCPKCNNLLIDPCTCGYPLKVTATKCPKCGKEYKVQ